MANQYDTNLKLQAIADAIGDTQSSGLISALEDIADAVAGGGGGGSSTAGLVSDNFSETDTYDLGDYCIHNNTMYVCINAITTPGPWDLSDWQATNTGIQLSSLNSALGNIIKYQDIIVGNITIETSSGFLQVPSQYLPAPPSGYSHLCTLVLNFGKVSTKDAFNILATGTYFYGKAGASITSARIRHYYMKSDMLGVI